MHIKNGWIIIISFIMVFNLIGLHHIKAENKWVKDELIKSRDWLESNNNDLREWGSIAYFSIRNRPYEKINSNNYDIKKEQELTASTDYQRKLVGMLANGKSLFSDKVQFYIKKIRNSQRFDGKFSDYINGNGGQLINAHIWGVLSLYVAGEPIPNKIKAREWLLENQHKDGGFGIEINSAQSDLDITAMAIMALHALGENKESPAVKKAISFIHKKQLNTGGFPSWGRETAESTSVVIQALSILDIDLLSKEWNKEKGNPLTALLQHQLDEGNFVHIIDKKMRSNNMATYQSMIALGDIYYHKSWVDRLRMLSIIQKMKDVPESNTAHDSIKKLMDKEIVGGFPDGTFRPNDTLTRAQFATIITNILDKKGAKEKQTTKNNNLFTDVISNHWAYHSIQYAASKHLMNGIGNNRFAPNKKITGPEVVAVLIRLTNKEKEVAALHENNRLWYDGAIRYAKNSGWIDRTFNIEKPMSREDAAILINRVGLK